MRTIQAPRLSEAGVVVRVVDIQFRQEARLLREKGAAVAMVARVCQESIGRKTSIGQCRIEGMRVDTPYRMKAWPNAKNPKMRRESVKFS